MPWKNHIKILWFVVPISLGILFGLNYLHSGQYKSYPGCCIKEISNFRMCCEEIFKIVANKMGLEVNKNIAKPIIMTNDQLTLEQFNRYLGWNSNEILPYYFHKKNIFVIPCYCKLDNLAHEYVHYFQAMYLNEDFNCTDSMITEVRELEAILIQKWFKTKFMRPHLAH